ncbi:MAG: hypothetical protein ACI4MK_10050 [Aristaeellaceae bacterium]
MKRFFSQVRREGPCGKTVQKDGKSGEGTMKFRSNYCSFPENAVSLSAVDDHLSVRLPWLQFLSVFFRTKAVSPAAEAGIFHMQADSNAAPVLPIPRHVLQK